MASKRFRPQTAEPALAAPTVDPHVPHESLDAARAQLPEAEVAEDPGFWSEMAAGLLGYSRAAVIGDIPADHTFTDPVRARFHEDLERADIPATLARQLQNQNYVQDQFGNRLPPEAAAAMLKNAAKLKDVLETGDRTDSAQAHADYMLDTIPSFTENGSSDAPVALHRMGVLWQTPGVAVDPGHLLREPRSLVERVQSLFDGDDQDQE